VFGVVCRLVNPNATRGVHNHVTVRADRVLIRGVVCATTLLLGCGGPSGGTVSLVLDIPNTMLDPKGFSSVEVRLHHSDGSDTEINVGVSNNQFDLGPIEVTPDVLIEAALRTEAGAAVGYGRVAAPVDLRDKERIVVPVRRPIVYFSGLVSEDPNPNTNNDRTWARTKPTFYDLAAGIAFDGTTQLATNAYLSVTAGPNLFAIDQMATTPSDMLVLTGAPTIRSVSTLDHSVAASSIMATLDGGVNDAAGTDDGKQLVVATTTHLFVVDTEAQTAKPIADGNFAKVAVVSFGDRAITAIAIRNRSSTGACTAELVWAAANSDDTNQVMNVGTSGYTDVAADAGRGFFVDNCKGGEFGEATATSATAIRGTLGKPAAVAVSNGQAFIGVEKTAGVSVITVPLTAADMPRTLFDETATQIVEATMYPGVLRRLDAQALRFIELEVGAGGDYVAWAISAKYHGDAIQDAFFPEIDVETNELRVVDVSTGAVVQNYRSTCEGTFRPTDPFDIVPWFCSLSPGQVEASAAQYDHRINSMTFQFGKK